ncbi:hypothetical protein NPIL_6721 [Nephila pilipes]|uniref:Uncharacterized protein n=1 Tax=Nephila pilipes TaxID=299642 RepID=A0A8X6Q8S9_NEPPI|nr:hypothetical protein NPIL_6721 [Nephila pilipes]
MKRESAPLQWNTTKSHQQDKVFADTASKRHVSEATNWICIESKPMGLSDGISYWSVSKSNTRKFNLRPSIFEPRQH